ncbi:C40 family peptidase [Streptomyces sp. NBC_01476]|uniref:C40 family peptidase n=1 Tax=Streptomyces sp. NBC_01476 TaxID=2903881 RepID=UPI002E34C273|nr:C40 family peptidase [Streptomyces sp. NBC_01476]
MTALHRISSRDRAPKDTPAAARPAPSRRTPSRASGRLGRLGAASVLTAAAVALPTLLPGGAQQADAAATAARALDVAASKKGSPYQWGAAGPSRFDCSGLTLYSFKQAGKQLPRTASAQYNSTKHIAAGSRQAGDLVFFHTGSSISSVYHVGIYAGGGNIWHAPKTGAKVRLERIWTGSVWYGRVN